ncbi:hypothetical protein [Streptomyces sp. AN091965]|nr:hypothetical protein [Streptomyces sp. AN091965]
MRAPEPPRWQPGCGCRGDIVARPPRRLPWQRHRAKSGRAEAG